MADVYNSIRKHHVLFKRYADELEEFKGDKRTLLKIYDVLNDFVDNVHSRIEDEILYPALIEASSGKEQIKKGHHYLIAFAERLKGFLHVYRPPLLSA